MTCALDWPYLNSFPAVSLAETADAPRGGGRGGDSGLGETCASGRVSAPDVLVPPETMPRCGPSAAPATTAEVTSALVFLTVVAAAIPVYALAVAAAWPRGGLGHGRAIGS